MSLNQLLAATDLSSSSLHAVDRGFLIASMCGAKYAVLHALGLDALAPLREYLGDDAPAVSQRIGDATRVELTRILERASRNLGVSADLELVAATAATAIPNYADAIDADLILVGAHGKGFLQRFLLGSTVSRLLRTSNRPVLVVKEPCRAPYRRILLAVDFSPASVRAIQLAKEVGADAELILLHVFDVPFEGKLRFAGVGDDVIHRYRIDSRERALQQLHNMARVAGVFDTDYEAVVRHGDANRQILAEEEARDCDLVVMGKHGTNATGELLLGSVTKRVLAESRSDVLVVVEKHAPNDADVTAQST